MGHNRNIKKVQSVSQVELLLYVFIKCPMSQYKIESCWVGPQAAGEAGRVPVGKDEEQRRSESVWKALNALTRGQSHGRFFSRGDVIFVFLKGSSGSSVKDRLGGKSRLGAC